MGVFMENLMEVSFCGYLEDDSPEPEQGNIRSIGGRFTIIAVD